MFGSTPIGLRDLLLQNPALAQTVASDSKQAACQAYKDVEGLRRLIPNTIGRSTEDMGCGWLYKPSKGVNPEINRGSFGTREGPLEKGEGAQWFWDMEEAEKKVTTDICKNIGKCSQLKLLGQYANVCGFCKTSGSVIPIHMQGGQATARYPADSALACEANQIVTNQSGSCPVKEGFWSVPRTEVSLDALEQCQPPLTRDCVILAARMSGCSDKGTLISALSQSKETEDYDTFLRTLPVFTAYQTAANPGITPAVLQDGSASLSTALDDFANLMRNGQSQQPKLRNTARDLCQGSGEGFQTYNFCSEVGPTTVITNTNLTCIQQDWKNKGGTEKGKRYAKLNSYIGKTYQSYLNDTTKLINELKSSDKNTNAAAILDFIGVDSSSPTPSLPRDDNTRGAETVWFNYADRQIPIVLRCDIRFAKDGEVYPTITSPNDYSKYKVTRAPIALSTAFEFRFDSDTRIQFQVRTDDGFALSVNQNPFENTSNKSNDWASWRVQGPTTYESGTYTMLADSKGKTNTIVTKWFEAGGQAYWDLKFKRGTGSWLDNKVTYDNRKDMYLTQEPLAPWMQYEICSRQNRSGGSATGFFERRWNGPIALSGSVQVPGFDVDANAVTFQTDKALRSDVPKGKAYASFTTSSWWHTASYFNFTAFRTITLLIRPTGLLAEGGTARSIFHHINFKNTFGTGLYIKRKGGKYSLTHWVGSSTSDIDITVGEWNFVVLQYIGDENNLRNVSCHVATLKSLQNERARRTFVDGLKAKQGGTGSTLYGSAVSDSKNAGYLILGGTSSDYKDNSGRVSWTSQSFEGDVAWLHGFRNYLDTEELLRIEINQDWKSRWPRAGLDGETV